jgi:hypothetical protein
MRHTESKDTYAQIPLFLFYYTAITNMQKVNTHVCTQKRFVVGDQFTMSRLRFKKWHT